MKIRIGLFGVVATLLGLATPVTAKDTLLISYPDHEGAAYYKPLIERTYANLGFAVRFVRMPAERRFIQLSQGQVDADLAGRDGIDERYKHIIKVPVLIANYQSRLLCQPEVRCEAAILNQPSATIHTNTGTLEVIRRANTPLQANVVTMESFEAMLRLFDAGRLEFVIIGNLDFVVAQWAGKYNAVTLLPPAEIYHYVHERHRDLVPQITEQLQQNLATYEPLKEVRATSQ